MMASRWKSLALVLLLFAAVGVWTFSRSRPALVVYCAHDAIHAQGIIDAFQRETGIPVRVKFDTEATKSLGLVELLSQESGRPQADVFWNNEWLGTASLAKRGALAPYKGAGYARIPERFKEPDGLWAGFAARLRVIIVNTKALAATDEAVSRLLESEDLSRVAIAKPLYGTTRTHYTALWKVFGKQGLIAWHEGLTRRGIQVVNGNAITKELVAEGVCNLGYTDTDDYFLAKDAGKPVAMLPARLPNQATVAIPNTVAMIRNAPHPDWAKRFIDFLLSESTETALANGPGRQIPLGSVDETALSDDVRGLVPFAAESVDLRSLEDVAGPCLEWLAGAFAG